MFHKMICMFFVLVFVGGILNTSSQAYAQETSLIDEAVSDIATVAFAALGGAVLGASTLSFVDKPKDHLENIVVGGALGIIIGVGYVAWSQATKSSNLYKNNAGSFVPDKDFSTSNRIAHDVQIRQHRWHEHTKNNVEIITHHFSF